MTLFALVISLLLFSVSALQHSGPTPGSPIRVIGTISDSSGAAIANAAVRVEMSGTIVAEASGGDDGHFELDVVSPGEARIVVTAPGFAPASEHVIVQAEGVSPELRFVLHPASIAETITVTASRPQARGLDSPASVSVLSSADLWTAAAATIDDAARMAPGFSLFRRSSSRVANPTAQGATLRGLSASGASRALVLADGMPLNDPFGGWVYWNRIPQAAIDRIEIARGAVGDLYGADAVGGLIQILTLNPLRPRLRASLEAGSHDTARLSAFAGTAGRGWHGLIMGEAQRSDGFTVVASTERGPIDTPAASNYRTLTVGVGHQSRAGFHAQMRGEVFSERRRNGTPLQVNDTDLRQMSTEVGGPAAGGVWIARAFGRTQSFDQAFTTIAADRRSEELTRAQQVPSTAGGVLVGWVRPWGSHQLLMGLEGRRVRGTTRETRFVGGQPLGVVQAGGSERTGSAFGQVTLRPSNRLTVGLGARGDWWKSTPHDRSLPEQSIGFLVPRGSISWQAHRAVTVGGAAHQAFRTPTLNELFRGFRVGGTVTLPNERLEPEELTGGEASVLVTKRHSSMRLVGFWNDLDKTITNVTLSVTPQLITRQRRNAGAMRSVGLEVEGDFTPHPRLTLRVAAAAIRSRFRESVGEVLEGNRVPQVPSHQFGVGILFAVPGRLILSSQVKRIGLQFEDDRNELRLAPATTVDLFAGRPVAHGIQGFVAIENLFDVEYDVGRTPTRIIGLPRTTRAGIRVQLP